MTRARRLSFVLLIILTFLAIRVAHAYASGYGEEDLKHLERQTGVVLPDWYAPVPWLLSGIRADAAVFVTQAIDPFGTDGYSDRILSPVQRFTRIGYPLAGWLLTGGRPSLAPIGLLAASLIGLAMLAWVADQVRDRMGFRAWLLVANPAVLWGFLRGTAEPLGMGLLALAMTGVVWASIAVGAVRPSLLTALADKPRLLIASAGTAILVRLGGMQLFGGSVDQGASEPFTWPFAGYLANGSPSIWLLAAIATWMVYVGVRQRRLAWLATGLLTVCLSPLVLEGTHAWRVSGAIWVLIAFEGEPQPRELEATKPDAAPGQVHRSR